MVPIQVKWGKESFALEYDPSSGYAGLTQLLTEKTAVPVERQKVMAKSKGLWKGVLKESMSVDWQKAATSTNGSLQLLLMGSAAQLTGPTQKTIFVEDLPPEQIAQVEDPAGLANLGNTCYMNSVVQCLRAIPSFRKGLTSSTASNGNVANIQRVLMQALSRTLDQLDSQTKAVEPFPLVQATKMAFPQFATTGANGAPQQQDAEEFYSAVLNLAAGETKSPAHLTAALPNSSTEDFMGATNVVDALFGLKMKETLKCDEVTDGSEPEVTSFDLHRKMVCNIQGGGTAAGSTTNISHIHEGLMLALQGQMEKYSDVLQRNATWTRTQRIARLPPIITVQFGRFYWKATPDSQDHAGVKCKIMKPVTFDTKLDVYEFCAPEIQKVLKKARDAVLKAEEDKVNLKLQGKSEESEKKEKESTGAEPMETGEDDDELQKALAMSMETDETNAPIGPGLPSEFQGIYELFAIVTHKGRDADGGHYMSWVKSPHQPEKPPKIGDTGQDNEDWYVYDDDVVSPCKTEDILKLKGGGDWHLSYLNFYRAKK